MRHAMRGVDTVIHLAATIRDQPRGTIEELNGLATVRLLRSAERAGVERFLFFSAMGATEFQRTRFFRAKALAERAVRESPLRHDRVRALDRLPARRPLDHPAGAAVDCCPRCPSRARGGPRYQPIWARDVAACVVAVVNGADVAQRPRRANGAARARPLRAGRARDAQLRRHRRAGAGGERARAPAAPRAAAAGPRRPARRWSWSAARPRSRPGRRPS